MASTRAAQEFNVQSPKSVLKPARYRSTDPSQFLKSIEVADCMIQAIVKRSNQKINEKRTMGKMDNYIAREIEATMENHLQLNDLKRERCRGGKEMQGLYSSFDQELQREEDYRNGGGVGEPKPGRYDTYIQKTKLKTFKHESLKSENSMGLSEKEAQLHDYAGLHHLHPGNVSDMRRGSLSYQTHTLGAHRSGTTLSKSLQLKKTNSDQRPQVKKGKSKKNFPAASSFCQPEAVSMVFSMQESIQHKYEEMLMNKNRHIDNFILKQRRIEQMRADKLEKIELSYRQKAENAVKRQHIIDKQKQSYHIDAHGKCTFIEKIKTEKLPQTIKQPLKVDLSKKPIKGENMHDVLFKQIQTSKYTNIYQNKLTNNIARLGKNMKKQDFKKKAQMDSQNKLEMPTEEDAEGKEGSNSEINLATEASSSVNTNTRKRMVDPFQATTDDIDYEKMASQLSFRHKQQKSFINFNMREYMKAEPGVKYSEFEKQTNKSGKDQFQKVLISSGEPQDDYKSSSVCRMTKQSLYEIQNKEQRKIHSTISMYSSNKPPSRNTHVTTTMRSVLAVTPGAGAARRRYQSIDFDQLNDGCKSTLADMRYNSIHTSDAKKRRDSIQASPDKGTVSILYEDDSPLFNQSILNNQTQRVFHSRNNSRSLNKSIKPGNFSTLNGFRQGNVFIRKKPNCIRTTQTNKQLKDLTRSFDYGY